MQFVASYPEIPQRRRNALLDHDQTHDPQDRKSGTAINEEDIEVIMARADRH